MVSPIPSAVTMPFVLIVATSPSSIWYFHLISPILSTWPTGSESSSIVITSQLFEQLEHWQVIDWKFILPTSQPLNLVGTSVYWWFSIANNAAPIAPIVWWFSGTTILVFNSSSNAFTMPVLVATPPWKDIVGNNSFPNAKLLK